MILGIGIDIVDIRRMEHWFRLDGILERFFHPEELAASRKRGSSAVLSLAARFAAKEAFGKALGTGMKGLILKDILVVNNHNGKPDIKLFGTAMTALRKTGGKRVLVSLTHEKLSAVAVVIIEGETS